MLSFLTSVLIDYTGGAYSSFATSPVGAASQLASTAQQFPGVSKSTTPIIQPSVKEHQELQDFLEGKIKDVMNIPVVEKGVPQPPTGGVGGIKVYRGGGKLDVTKVSNQGISLSTSPEVAKEFAQGVGKGGNIEEFYLSPNAKIATIKDAPTIAQKVFPNASPEMALESLKLHLGVETPASILDAFKKAGFDGIDYGDISPVFAEKEIRILNPNVLKSQPPTGGVGGVEPITEPISQLGVQKAENIPVTVQPPSTIPKKVGIFPPSEVESKISVPTIKEGQPPQSLGESLEPIIYYYRKAELT